MERCKRCNIPLQRVIGEILEESPDLQEELHCSYGCGHDGSSILERARADYPSLTELERKARAFDWLSVAKKEVHFWNNNGNHKCSLIPDWDAPLAEETLIEKDTLLEAVEEAMRREDATT